MTFAKVEFGHWHLQVWDTSGTRYVKWTQYLSLFAHLVQFRLYVGLLGQPPVWYRTDLQQNPDDIVDGMEADDEAPFEKGAAAPQTDDQKKDKNIFDDFYDEDIEVDEPTRTQPTSGVENSSRPMQRKRVPPRTPYALHNIVPAALSSSSQVKTLLSIAQVRKHQKLESFIYTPDISLRIFFSWYPHHQGFIFSPSTLINLPRLVLFFLEFLVRTKAVYESDQALKAAVELTKKAVTELPATGKLCKLLPDKMGLGCSLLWGKRWIEEDQPFRLGEKREEEARQEAEKKFEEELKNENVQVMSSERILRQEKEFNSAIEKDSNDDEDDSRAEISIQILSPTSPAFSNSAETPTAFIEEVVAKSTISTQKAEERTPAVQDAPSANADLTTKSATAHAPWMVNKETLPHPESEQCLSIPPRWDANPDDPPSAHDRLRLDAWVPKVGQPLMALFGMTVLPLKYKAEVAERSMRRVKEVIPAGGKSKEAGMERRWRSVQEDLVEKLARVVLEPWLDWDDGGIAPTYRRPRVQISPEVQRAAEQDPNISRVQEEKPRGQEQLHDPEKDVIVILVENRVAEQISVGMGLAGTWVQMVRIQDYRKEAGISAVDVTEGGGHEGYSRGRGRGRGRGGATCGGKGKEDKTGTDPDSSATTFSHIEAADQVANDSLSERQIARKEETSTQGARRGWRGRGRGRGGHHHSGGFEKEFVFWYVEDIVVAIPSFWMAGKEEEPIRLPEGEEEQDFELSDLED